MKKFFVVLAGPTGVGKSNIAIDLAQSLPIEIINADIGSFYQPLTIGTAKPDLSTITVPHHLFNILSEPRNFSVKEYRELVITLMEKIWERNKIPVLVGGSLFYLQALFFPPHEQETEKLSESQIHDLEKRSTHELWDLLNEIDTARAQALYPEDRYRILRALIVWYATHKKPSELVPQYQPIADCYWIFVQRNRDELYQRINNRVILMMKGWLEEVQQLSPAWQEFLMIKRLIGYPEILEFLKTSGVDTNDAEKEKLIEIIQQNTRNYAKRQITFWRMLKKKLLQESKQNSLIVEEWDLTLLPLNLYIDQLSQRVRLFGSL